MKQNKLNLGLYITGLVVCGLMAAALNDVAAYWHWVLVGVAVVSSIAAYGLVLRKPKLENTGIKILVWGTYFWVLTFAQLMVFALLYHFFG